MTTVKKVLSAAERKEKLLEQTAALRASNAAQASIVVGKPKDERTFQSNRGVTFRARIIYISQIEAGKPPKLIPEYNSSRTSDQAGSFKFAIKAELGHDVVINEEAEGISWAHADEALRFDMTYVTPTKDPAEGSTNPALKDLRATSFLQQHDLVQISGKNLSDQLAWGDEVSIDGFQLVLTWSKKAGKPEIFMNALGIKRIGQATPGVSMADPHGNLGAAIANYFRENNIPIHNRTKAPHKPSNKFQTYLIPLVAPEDVETRIGKTGVVPGWEFYKDSIAEGLVEKKTMTKTLHILTINAYPCNWENGTPLLQSIIWRFTIWNEDALFMGPKSFERTFDLAGGYMPELDLTIIGSIDDKETDKMDVNSVPEGFDGMDLDHTSSGVETWGEAYRVAQICSNWANIVQLVGVQVDFATIKQLHRDNLLKCNTQASVAMPDPPGQILYLSDCSTMGVNSLADAYEKYPYQYYVMVNLDKRGTLMDKLPADHIDTTIGEHWAGKILVPNKKVSAEILLPALKKTAPPMVHLFAVRPLPPFKLMDSVLPPAGLKPLPEIFNDLPESILAEPPAKKQKLAPAAPAPAAPLVLTVVQKSLMDLIRANTAPEGAPLDELLAEGLDEKEARAAVDFLVNEGLIFSTVDDLHFKITD